MSEVNTPTSLLFGSLPCSFCRSWPLGLTLFWGAKEVNKAEANYFGLLHIAKANLEIWTHLVIAKNVHHISPYSQSGEVDIEPEDRTVKRCERYWAESQMLPVSCSTRGNKFVTKLSPRLSTYLSPCLSLCHHNFGIGHWHDVFGLRNFEGLAVPWDQIAILSCKLWWYCNHTWKYLVHHDYTSTSLFCVITKWMRHDEGKLVHMFFVAIQSTAGLSCHQCFDPGTFHAKSVPVWAPGTVPCAVCLCFPMLCSLRVQPKMSKILHERHKTTLREDLWDLRFFLPLENSWVDGISRAVLSPAWDPSNIGGFKYEQIEWRWDGLGTVLSPFWLGGLAVWLAVGLCPTQVISASTKPVFQCFSTVAHQGFTLRNS